MRITGLKALQICPAKNQSGEISRFGQTQLASDISSICYSFKMLYQDLKIPQREIEPSLLQKYGVMEVGNSAKEGIRILGREFNHVISSPSDGSLKLVFLNKLNGTAERIITIENKSSFYEQTKSNRLENFEETVSETLDFLNWQLIGFRNKITPAIPQPYIPNKLQSEALEKINKSLKSPTQKLMPVAEAFLKEEDMQLSKDIIAKFKAIKEAFMKFNNNTTRYNVKTYYKNFISKDSSVNTYAFKGIGPNKENLSISLLSNKGQDYVMIKAYDENKVSAFIISSNGAVQKNMPYETVKTAASHKRYDAAPDYYTQAELDKSNLPEYLKCITKELTQFEEHTKNWHKKQCDFTTLHTNTDIGSTSAYSAKIKQIANTITKIKTNLRKRFPYISNSEEFRKANNINIEFSRRGVRLIGITPEKYDIRITFPIVNNETATQLLVMDGEKIIDSYCILEEKLLRLDVKNPKNAFTHSNRAQYYYPQEYIDSSKLGEYLGLTLKSLKKTNKIIENA